MEFISNYNLTFIKFINKKHNKKFQSFDDYSLFLFEKTSDEVYYYYELEQDLKEYCQYQKERKRNNGKTTS
jgi:hypothetical protein